MRSFRTRKHVSMPAPRPFRITKCTVGDREDLVQTLQLVDAAMTLRKESDGAAAMAIVYDTLVAAEPSLLLARDDLFAAASWGAAYHRLQLGECPDIPAESLRAEPGFIDSRLFNAIAWTGIEVGGRLEPRISALGDYCVRVGHYVAHNGGSGVTALEAELTSWAHETAAALRDHTFRAFSENQLVGEFWLDIDGAPHGRSAMPLRPVHSIEKIYDDIIFDMAWDDLNDALGRGRPRKTEALDWLAPLTWEPPLSSQTMFFLPLPADPHDKLGLDLSHALGGYNGASVFGSLVDDEPLTYAEPPTYAEPLVDDESLTYAVPVVDEPPTYAVPVVDPAPIIIPIEADVAPAAAPETVAPVIDLRVAEPVVVAPLILPPPRVIPAGWYGDPLQRFDHRWWDGAQWCDIVSSKGAPLYDPLRLDALSTF
jgi:hypothetical protein